MPKASTDHLTDTERNAIAPIIRKHVERGKPLDIQAILAKPLMLRRLTKEQLMRCIRAEVAMAQVNFDHVKTKKARTEKMVAMVNDLKYRAQRLEVEVEEERKSNLEVLRQVEEEKQAALEAQRKAEEERNAKLDAEERAKEEKQAALEALHKVQEERQARMEFSKRMELQEKERMALESQCNASKEAIDKLKRALSIAKESQGQHKPDKTQIEKLELELKRAKSEANIAEKNYQDLTIEYEKNKQKMDEMWAQVQRALEAKNQEIAAQKAALEKSCSEVEEKLKAAKIANLDELIEQHNLLVKEVFKVNQALQLSNLRLDSFKCGPTLEAEIRTVSPVILGTTVTRSNMESVRKRIIERWQVLLQRSGTLDAFSLRCCLPKAYSLMSIWLEIRNKFAHQKEAQEMSAQEHQRYQHITRQLLVLFRDVEDATRGRKVDLMRFEDVE